MRVRFRIPLKAPATVKRSVSQEDSRNAVGAQSEAILLALQNKTMSSSELAAVLGLQSKTGSLKRSLKELLLSKQIEYTIPEKPSSRLQKYRLTAQSKNG